MDLKGKVISKKTSCCELLITPLYDPKTGELWDISVHNVGQGCKSSIQALSACAGALLELDLKHKAIDVLKDHVCGGCTSARTRFPREEKQICKSCSDAIARALAETPDKVEVGK